MKQTVTITGENMNVVFNPAAEANASTAAATTRAEKRIAALRAAGYDMSRYFAFGDEQVIEIKDGKAVPVDFAQFGDAFDETEKVIVKGGYIDNWSLFRRWVTAQMFHMLADMKDGKYSFNEVLQRKGYEYQWKMLEREIFAQTKMRKHGDSVNFKARNLWFNGHVAASMAHDYIDKLRKYIEENLIFRYNSRGVKVYKHTCKGAGYIRLANNDIFVDDLRRKVYAPLYDMASQMEGARDVDELYTVIRKFNKTRKHLQWRTKQSIAFIDAYKGSGAFYTMRNLIIFHGAHFGNGSSTGRRMTKAQSLSYLADRAEKYTGEGWRMLGVLKELISDSGISVQGKLDEWRK